MNGATANATFPLKLEHKNHMQPVKTVANPVHLRNIMNMYVYS